MEDSKKNTPIPIKNEDKQDNLDVNFNDTKTEKKPKKPGKKVYETANKYLATSSKYPTSKEGVFNVTRAFDDNAVELGTIVSDKKRKHTSLVKSIKDAGAEWWGKAQKTVSHPVEILESKADKRRHKNNRRKNSETNVIKKPSKSTEQKPTGENIVVIEKIKTFSKDVEKIKGAKYKTNDVPKKHSSWHPVEKEVVKKEVEVSTRSIPKNLHIESPDMRNDMVAPVVKKRIQKNINTYEHPGVKKKNKKAGENKPKDEKPVSNVHKTKLPPISRRKAPDVTSSVFVSPKVVQHSTQKLPTKESPIPISVSQEKLKRDDELVSHENKTNVKVPLPPIKTIGASQKETHKHLKSSDPIFTTHKITTPERDIEIPIKSMGLPPVSNNESSSNVWSVVLRIFIIVIIVGSIVSIAIYGVYKFNNSKKETATPVEIEPSPIGQIDVVAFFQADTQIPIYITGSKDEFLSTLKDSIDTAPTGVTQFYPVRETGDVLQNISTQEIFEFLNTDLERRSIQVLESVYMFGGVTTDYNEPYIIIRSYNFDTLFAGFLEWEPTMYYDFIPLFGDAGISSISFVDAVKDNASVRILYDESGQEILLYAFINRNTVVITSSAEALSKIIERL